VEQTVSVTNWVIAKAIHHFTYHQSVSIVVKNRQLVVKTASATYFLAIVTCNVSIAKIIK
jgi:hypothetical protein